MTESETQTAHKKRTVKREHARVIDYRRTFDTEHGKKVLADLCSAHYMMQTSVNVQNPDPHITAFNEGQRLVVGRILNLLKVDPYKFQQILEEIDNAARREHANFAATTTASGPKL